MDQVKINLADIPEAKSLLIRGLLVQSYNPDIHILGENKGDDVIHMRAGLEQLEQGLPVNCGDAATVFRFLAVKASRLKGTHIIYGSSRLLARPHGVLISILNQLGVEVQVANQQWVIRSEGWKIPASPVIVDGSISSQFMSALLLNCWELTQPIEFRLADIFVSESYFQMSLKLAKDFGLTWLLQDKTWRIEAGQKPLAICYQAEKDMGCVFALVALSIFRQGCVLPDFKADTLQPDSQFIEVMRRMGVNFTFEDGSLFVYPCKRLKAIDVNLEMMPDMFPVLSVLCAFADGESHLFGAPHLKFKESNRIEKIAELINQLGAQATVQDDGLKIVGLQNNKTKTIEFDALRDHRLAMAAGVAQAAGAPLQIEAQNVVAKSFPKYWHLAERINGRSDCRA